MYDSIFENVYERSAPFTYIFSESTPSTEERIRYVQTLQLTELTLDVTINAFLLLAIQRGLADGVLRLRRIDWAREGAVAAVDGLDPAVVPLDGDGTVLVSKVRCLRHVAEEPDLHDAREHLEAREQRVRVAHHLLRERRVDHEVAVVCHDRPGFELRHSQNGVGRTEEVHVVQHLCVGELRDLNWNALLELGG